MPELSFDTIRTLLCTALTGIFPQGGDIVDLFADRCIVRFYSRDGKLYEIPYTITDGVPAFGDATEVRKEVGYVRVATPVTLTAAVGEKADDDYGYKWRVQIIEWGLSKDGAIYWDKEPIRAAMGQYEGAKVFALTEAQHQAKPHPYGKSVRDLVGWLENVQENATGLEGDFNILKAASWLRDMVVDSFERGKPDLIGLSNDVMAETAKKLVAGKRVPCPTEIRAVTVDVVYNPAGGGRFIQLAAATRNENEEDGNMLEKLLAALKDLRPDVYKTIEPKVEDGTITEEDIDRAVAAAGPMPVRGETGSGDAAKQAQDILTQARIIACGITLKDELTASGLPTLSAVRLTRQYENRVFETEALRASIREEKEYLDQLLGSGSIEGAGGLRVVADQKEKNDQMLDAFFEGKPGAMSFKACYIQITGDERVTGHLKAARRFTASIESTTWAEVLGDAITRRMLAEYRLPGLDDWRKIVEVVPASDFRTNHRPRMGGYGDLPTVAQGDPYGALGSPSDEEATYMVSKKGGTEEITLEAIKNDDVGAIRRVPVKLSRAAKRTLFKFVFDFLKDNAAIYDAVALFHSSHGNLGSAALDAANLNTRRVAMYKQTEADSAEQIGLVAKYVVVPIDLQKTAFDLVVTPNAGNYVPTAPDFLKTLTWEMIVVPYWTDTNNWYEVADPKDCPTIEIAFLDGNEEPELFVQDMPNVGSMFSNDKLTYKIRHIYGGAVMDYRPFQGSIVT
jgi:hypothetical protein